MTLRRLTLAARRSRTAAADAASVFLRDVGHGLLEVSHNTLALIGLMLAAVLVFTAGRADIRHEVEAWSVGPEEEDPDYAAECRELAAAADGSESRIKLLGFRKVDDIFPRMGVNVLTSISEAQPLVVLEGFAAGVPCVATDVGCCRELIEGTDAADRALGSAGAVVRIADPEATAVRILELLDDPARWRAAQQAGIARVERSYTDALMLQRYRDLYRASLAESEAQTQARTQTQRQAR